MPSVLPPHECSQHPVNCAIHRRSPLLPALCLAAAASASNNLRLHDLPRQIAPLDAGQLHAEPRRAVGRAGVHVGRRGCVGQDELLGGTGGVDARSFVVDLLKQLLHGLDDGHKERDQHVDIQGGSGHGVRACSALEHASGRNEGGVERWEAKREVVTGERVEGRDGEVDGRETSAVETGGWGEKGWLLYRGIVMGD